MAFVFSFWYIIMIVLVAGIAACLVVFFQMDKKDRVLIEEFVKASEVKPQEEIKQEEAKEIKEETKSNE